jgi:hypothetical protein
MLPRIVLLATTMAAAALADILVVPAHVRFTGPISNLGSISSDSEIIGELDYQENTTAPAGVSLSCPRCPFAVNSSNGESYTFQSAYAQNAISVTFDTANKQLNLNGNPFLDSQMKDLHRPQITTQTGSYLDFPNIYNGSLPITYDVRVVQVRTVQLEDGSLIEFYSIDVEVLSLGDRPINVQKVNVHVINCFLLRSCILISRNVQLDHLPFTYAFPKNPSLAAVSVPDFPSQSSTEPSAAPFATATSPATVTTSPSATTPSLYPSTNSTSGGS